MEDQLVECEYCGGVRVYDPVHACPGCGARLKKPKVKQKAQPTTPHGWEDLQRSPNYGWLQAQYGNMGMQQTHAGMLGMERVFLFGGSHGQAMRGGTGK